MIRIKYSQKNVKFVPTKKVTKKKKKRKRTIIEVKSPAETVIPKKKDIKVIQFLFGNIFRDKQKLHKELSKSVASFSIYDDVVTHFVLGKDNKNMLLEKGVAESKIILIDKKPFAIADNTSNFNKTFLMKCASEVFPQDELLYFDFDCYLVRKFDKDDIFKKLQEHKSDLQAPTVGYKTRRLRGFGDPPRKQKWGLMCCFVYCRDHDIIKRWYNNHLTKLYYESGSDEAALLYTIEDLYGKLSMEEMYRFDTTIVATARRLKWTDAYSPENYKKAYFFHR